MPERPDSVRLPWTAGLLAAALLAGGLRDPRLAALGEASVFALVWAGRPALGPAGPWLPWLGWAVLSALLGSQPLAGAPAAARWAAALAFASLAASWDAREREWWLKTLVVLTPILAAAALWTGAAHGFKGTMTGLIPPYYNYTAFAVAAGTAAASAWALHPRGPRTGVRAAALAVAALGAACLLLARARGAMIGLGVAGAVWAGRRWGAKAAGVAVVAGILGGGAFQAGLLPSAWNAALVKSGRRYQEARPEIWRRAAEIAGENPWLGVGPGNFGAAFARRPVEAVGGSARWGFSTPFAHSEPLNAAAETGWAGLALWLLALGTCLSALWGRAGEEPSREAAAAAAAGMAAHLLADNMLQIPGLAFLFFSTLAVAGPRVSFAARWPRAAAAAGLALALVSWIPRAAAGRDPSRAAALFPAEAPPREDLAYGAMAAGRRDEADVRWAEAAERAPFDAVYPWRRAQIAGSRGRWEAAREFADRAAFLEPGFLNARTLRAEALVHLGRSGDARLELAEILRSFHERGNRISGSGYDAAVWDFDRKEYDRVSALAARKSR